MTALTARLAWSEAARCAPCRLICSWQDGRAAAPRLVVRPGAECHRRRRRLAIADVGGADRVAGLVGLERGADILDRVDRRAVDRGDHVAARARLGAAGGAAAQAGRLGRAARWHLDQEHALADGEIE